MFSEILIDELPDVFDSKFNVEQLSPLYGKRILFVMGGAEGKLIFYQRAFELGVRMVMMDGAGHWTQDYVEQGLFEAFIEIPIDDHGGFIDNALVALLDSGLDFDGIATFCDPAGSLTARFAYVMGLPVYPISGTSITHSKSHSVSQQSEHSAIELPLRKGE